MSRSICLTTAILTLVASLEVGAVNDKKVLTPALRERCLDVLRRGLASDEFWPAMHAAEALTQAGLGKEVLTRLKELEPKETDGSKRCGLAREMVRAGDRSKTATLLDILANGDLKGKIHAAESLYKVAETGDGELLRKALAQEESVSLQMMAAAALARKGDAGAMALLRKRLAGADSDGRMLSAFVLGRLGDKSDIAQLTKNGQTETDALKKAFAQYAAAILGDAGSRETIVKNLSAESNDVRTYAAEAAGAAKLSAAADGLTTLLDDPVLDIRIRAAQALILIDAK